MLSHFKNSRSLVAYGHDLIMAGLSFPLALYLRLGDRFDSFTEDYLAQGTLIFVLLAGLVFAFSRLYRGIWRYASVNDMTAILRAVTILILVFLPVLFFMVRLENVPRSTPIIQWFLLVAMMGGPRFLYRTLKDRRFRLIHENGVVHRIPVLLVGAGDEAELFIREQQRGSDVMYDTVGVLSLGRGRVGRDIRGIPVVGTATEAERVIDDVLKTRPERIILTQEKIDGAVVRDLLSLCEREGITLSRMPKLSEFRHALDEGHVSVKPIAVEDLLGRPQTRPDRVAMESMVEGKTVLVTGAGGSIGSELVRQLCPLSPARMILLDASEYQLYQIDREMGEEFPDMPKDAVLGDVRDYARLKDVMMRMKPDLVFHAAALKHVPLVEANPMEGLLTNVIGSRNVADAARSAGVACMVMISTDKAVNPTNVMGASKRLAECYIQALDPVSRAEGGTSFVAVRFGNVLGSTGSVIPLFQRQLAKGGPLTVTHPEINRYFMTIREAVELVLQASTFGMVDKEAMGRLFVLDMGKPVKIVDLARQMILLAGLKPDEDVKIEFTGLRPGEKLYEELLHEDEDLQTTDFDGILLAAPRVGALDELQKLLSDLEEKAKLRDRRACLEILKSQVPEFELEAATLEAEG